MKVSRFNQKLRRTKKIKRRHLSSRHLKRVLLARISLLGDELLKETLLKEKYKPDPYLRWRDWKNLAIVDVSDYRMGDVYLILDKLKQEGYDLCIGSRRTWMKRDNYSESPVIVIFHGVLADRYKEMLQIDNVW